MAIKVAKRGGKESVRGHGAVLFVSHSSGLHGAERSLLDLLDSVPNGQDVIVLLPGRGPIEDELNRKGVQYFVVRYNGWFGCRWKWLVGPWRLMVNVVALFRILIVLNGVKLKAVYTNTLFSPIGAFVAAVYKLPHIWHIREFVEEDFGAHFYIGENAALSIVNSLSTKIIYNSHAVKRKFERHLCKPESRVIHNGPIDEAMIGRGLSGGMAEARWRLVFVGRIEEGKGIFDAVNSLPLLHSRGLGVDLHVIGTGVSSYVRRVRMHLKRHGLEEYVYWHGYQKDWVRYLEPNVLVVCSRAEAFGRVAVEGMAAGYPVIVSDGGALPEVVEEGKSGLLYRSGDAVSLAEAIARLLTDDELRGRIIEGGKIRAKQFSRCRYASAVWSQILNEDS